VTKGDQLSAPSQRKIRDLLRTRERSRVDYKRSYHLRTNENKNELAKDICAIANFLYQANGKGYLIIGADDNGTPIGVNHSDYGETRLQQVVGARTDPPPIFHVHHTSYAGSDLVILEIRRHSSGPHQVKIGTISQGFPTRRGSSTEAMDTIEVFQAMQVRGRSFVKAPSEYRTLSPSSAYSQIQNDLVDSLVELGVPRRSIQLINMPGSSEIGNSYAGRHFINFIKIINRRRWNFYASWSSSNEDLTDMQWHNGSLFGLSRIIPIHRSIILHFVNGTITNSFFNRQQQYSGRFVKVQIEPRITYFGLGQGATRASTIKYMSLPKFYISHIKSKEDIKMRTELTLNWIGQQQQLFEDIRSILT